MAFKGYFVLGLIALVVVGTSKVTCEIEADKVSPIIDFSLNRNSFPEGFIFGAASSSYQVRVYNIALLTIQTHILYRECSISS